MTRAALFLFAAVLAGCTAFPELDGTASPEAQRAPFPRIVPVDQALAPAAETAVTGATVSTLAGRAAALRRRAGRLSRQPALAPGDRRRLLQAIDRHHP